MARRILIEWLALLALAIGAAILLVRAELTDRVDNRILDFATSLGRAAPDGDIVIVGIDDTSLEEIGAWPWPRERHAALIDRLDAAGASRIVYDVLFIEPTDEAQDNALAAAISRAANVALPMTFVDAPNATSGSAPVLPLDSFARSADRIGHVAAVPDADGVLRQFELERQAGGKSFPHLMVAGEPDLATALNPIVSANPAGSFRTVAAADVIAGRVPDGFLRDSTVLVGAIAQGMGDRFSVAAGRTEVLPGVEVQANLLNALRNGAVTTPLGPWASIALAVAALLIQFLVFWKASPRAAFVATLGISAALLAGTIALVPLAGLWIAPSVALLFVLLAYPFWSWRRLTAVSSYLEREARMLQVSSPTRQDGEGFDQIARQVSRMHALVGQVNERFQFLRQMIEAAPDAIVVFDENRNISMVNRKFAAILPGHDEEGIASFDDLLARNSATMNDRRDELSIEDGGTFLIARGEFEIGETREHSTIVALRDVTELRARDRERREMLEFLSHDMRTPQVAIIGLADRMKDEGLASPDVRARIRNQAERTLKLADDFVQLARLNEAEIELEDVDLAALCEEACDTAYSAAKAKKITIETDLYEADSFIRADASLIARLIDNLVGNAIKYSPEGSEVRMRIVADGESHVELVVSDNGPGLSSERRKSPFARFGAHAKRAGPSAGLGLAFVKRVVDRHHGTIAVESRPGEGTAFRVKLPRASGG